MTDAPPPSTAPDTPEPPRPFEVVIRRGPGPATSLGPLPGRVAAGLLLAALLVGSGVYVGVSRRSGGRTRPDPHEAPSGPARQAVYEGRGGLVFDNYKDAAEGGDVEAMRILARHCLEPGGGPGDAQGASAWWERAAGAGDVESRRELARLHAACCEERASAWLREAGEAGDDDAFELLLRGGAPALADGRDAPAEVDDLEKVFAARRARLGELQELERAAIDQRLAELGVEGNPIVLEDLEKRMQERGEGHAARVRELLAALRGGDAAAAALLRKERDRLEGWIRQGERVHGQ